MGLPTWASALTAFVVLLAVGFVAWRFLRRRPSPEEIERLRRLEIHQKGKLADGEIVDVDGVAILYSYSVAGVIYTTTQDVTALEGSLPEDRMSMVGPVTIKFDPRNPANSILLSEQWSGLRIRTQSNLTPRTKT